MIQPVSALTPQAAFRGLSGAYKAKSPRERAEANIAMINAGGVALAAGGITTAVSRAYTSSWPSAAVVGLFGSFLAMFFMSPKLIEKVGLTKASKSIESEVISKSKPEKVLETAKEHLKPARKLVLFKQA